MPATSSNSFVHRWPDAANVIAAAETWARDLAERREDVLRVGCIGSYARGDWGVGSDLDVVLIVRESAHPFHQRNLEFDTLSLPVPVDLLVYTADEWEKMISGETRFGLMLKTETRWLFDR
jgi:uncharacterized protein